MRLNELVETLSNKKTNEDLQCFLKNFKKIGAGTTRKVYKVTLSDGSAVVIKVSHDQFWHFINTKEYSTFQALKSPYLAEIFAIEQTSKPRWLVMEFIPKCFTNKQAQLLEDFIWNKYKPNQKWLSKFEKFATFLEVKNLLNDLHRKNLGFRLDNTPAIFDYGG